MSLIGPVAQNAAYPGGLRGYSEMPYMPIGSQDIFGNYPGFGDAVLFGYLTQIWMLAWFGQGFEYIGTLPDVNRIDSLRGLNDSRAQTLISGPYTNEEMTAVVVEITQYPLNSDFIFGEPPLISAGYCGWGWESNTDHRGALIPTFTETPIEFPTEGENFRNGPILGGIGLNINLGQEFARTRPEPINQNSGVFFPPSRNCVDFWWHLKEGVRANIHAYSARQCLGAEVISGGVSVPFNPGDTGSCPSWTPFGIPHEITAPDGTSCTGGT